MPRAQGADASAGQRCRRRGGEARAWLQHRGQGAGWPRGQGDRDGRGDRREQHLNPGALGRRRRNHLLPHKGQALPGGAGYGQGAHRGGRPEARPRVRHARGRDRMGQGRQGARLRGDGHFGLALADDRRPDGQVQAQGGDRVRRRPRLGGDGGAISFTLARHVLDDIVDAPRAGRRAAGRGAAVGARRPPLTPALAARAARWLGTGWATRGSAASSCHRSQSCSATAPPGSASRAAG
mmetsp:Transcript_11265/g.33842  ORF Transcript_11265/g.33842 Transcript_11265/m.33842 type:complete len:238 (-) Transcript_11265:470-1183(-)